MTAEQLGGDIYPGEERTFKFTGRLLGKENETKTLKVVISFQPKDLKSRNEVSTTFTTIFKRDSPLISLWICLPRPEEARPSLSR